MAPSSPSSRYCPVRFAQVSSFASARWAGNGCRSKSPGVRLARFVVLAMMATIRLNPYAQALGLEDQVSEVFANLKRLLQQHRSVQ
jgi:hypothetical protein